MPSTILTFPNVSEKEKVQKFFLVSFSILFPLNPDPLCPIVPYEIPCQHFLETSIKWLSVAEPSRSWEWLTASRRLWKARLSGTGEVLESGGALVGMLSFSSCFSTGPSGCLESEKVK